MGGPTLLEKSSEWDSLQKVIDLSSHGDFSSHGDLHGEKRSGPPAFSNKSGLQHFGFTIYIYLLLCVQVAAFSSC